MGTQLLTNFDLKSKIPNFERDEFDTLLDMKNVNENFIPNGYITYCKEVKNHYVFHAENDVDAISGKWRLFLDLPEDITSIRMLENKNDLNDKYKKFITYVKEDNTWYVYKDNIKLFVPVTNLNYSKRLEVKEGSLVFEFINNHGGEAIGIKKISLLNNYNIIDVDNYSYESYATSSKRGYKPKDMFIKSNDEDASMVNASWLSADKDKQLVVLTLPNPINIDSILIHNFRDGSNLIENGVKDFNIYYCSNKKPDINRNIDNSFKLLYSGRLEKHDKKLISFLKTNLELGITETKNENVILRLNDSYEITDNGIYLLDTKDKKIELKIVNPLVSEIELIDIANKASFNNVTVSIPKIHNTSNNEDIKLDTNNGRIKLLRNINTWYKINHFKEDKSVETNFILDGNQTNVISSNGTYHVRSSQGATRIIVSADNGIYPKFLRIVDRDRESEKNNITIEFPKGVIEHTLNGTGESFILDVNGALVELSRVENDWSGVINK